MKIEHANITVNNLETSARFYSELFGGEVRWEGITEGGQNAAHVGTGDSYLSLFEATDPGRAPADYAATGFNHLGFQVEDLNSFRNRLGEMGVPLKAEESYNPGRRLYFYDPDGIEIELVEY